VPEPTRRRLESRSHRQVDDEGPRNGSYVRVPAGRPFIPEFPGVPGLAENRMKQISQQPRESARYSSLRSSNGHDTAAATRSSSSPGAWAPRRCLLWPPRFRSHGPWLSSLRPRGTGAAATANEHRLLVARAGSCGAGGLPPPQQGNTQCVDLATQCCIQRPIPPAPGLPRKRTVEKARAIRQAVEVRFLVGIGASALGRPTPAPTGTSAD